MLPAALYSHANSKERLVLPCVRLGEPIEKSQRLIKVLGLTDRKRLKELRAEGEEGLVSELLAFNSKEKDQYGWTDSDWLHYFRDKAAGRVALPAGAGALDERHAGKTLSDFVKDPIAVGAGLDKAMVLALRLYSSPVHVTVNKYLRLGCSAERPHPYPALVVTLVEAFAQLRQASAAEKEREKAAKEAERANGAKAKEDAEKETESADAAAAASTAEEDGEEGEEEEEEEEGEGEEEEEEEMPGDTPCLLTLTIKHGVNFMSADANGLSDPFLRFTLDGADERKTKVRRPRCRAAVGHGAVAVVVCGSGWWCVRGWVAAAVVSFPAA